MGKNDLHNAWQSISYLSKAKTRNELAVIIETKAKKAINKFRLITAISGIVSIGLIIFLTLTALNRLNDTWYVLNNILLGLITIASLISALKASYSLSKRDSSISIKQWLKKNIMMISGSLNGKYKYLSLLVIPIVFILILLSINVYFSNMQYIEVFSSEKSTVALIVGFIIGLTVSFFVERKLHKYHLQNLHYLEELYRKI